MAVFYYFLVCLKLLKFDIKTVLKISNKQRIFLVPKI